MLVAGAGGPTGSAGAGGAGGGELVVKTGAGAGSTVAGPVVDDTAAGGKAGDAIVESVSANVGAAPRPASAPIAMSHVVWRWMHNTAERTRQLVGRSTGRRGDVTDVGF
jgi:hypothetical protein